MNVVVFCNYSSSDDRTRINFLRKLANFKDIAFYIAKPQYTLSDIAAIDPDILLFVLHQPEIRHTWDNKLFTCGVHTIVLEEDHYETKFEGLVYADKTIIDWYAKKNISLILRRHCYEEKAPVESVWLPFSANEKEFYPLKNLGYDRQITKIYKIGFAGSYTSQQIYYDVRRLAISKLLEAKLLDENYGRIYDGYAEYLRSHISCLACTGGLLHTCLAKTFEIPLSGSALLTNRMDHPKILWGNKKCYFEYKDNCSDITEIARYILENNNEVQEVTKNGLLRVLEAHTDQHRIVELYNILHALVQNKPVPKIWGQ